MSNIWANLLTILVGGLLVNNFVMNRFLGCCPFLGVSKQYDTAKGMSMSVSESVHSRSMPIKCSE